MAQSTDSAINSGAGNSRGHLDIDYSLVDYSQPISKDNSGEIEIKEFNKIPLREILIEAGGAISVLLAGGGVIAIKRKKKDKRKVYR